MALTNYLDRVWLISSSSDIPASGLVPGSLFAMNDGSAIYYANSSTTFSTIGKSQVSVCTSQLDKTNTTFSDVTGLTVNLTSGRKYLVKGLLNTNLSAGGLGKFQLTGTATASAIWYSANNAPVSTTVTATALATALATSVSFGASGDNILEISGVLTCSGSGTLKVQFAQATASGTSSVRVNSMFKVEEI